MAHVAYGWRSGRIEIGHFYPEGVLPFGAGTPEQLEKALSATATLAYDNKTWLVPGLGKAGKDDEVALAEAQEFAAHFTRALEAAKA